MQIKEGDRVLIKPLKKKGEVVLMFNSALYGPGAHVRIDGHELAWYIKLEHLEVLDG